jgi:dTDP-4-dehydrorhamnose 3,5-epimerase
MTLNYAVISGMAKLVLVDRREGSATFDQIDEIFLGEDNYLLVHIPPGIVNGYKAIGTKPVVLANCASHPHDPNEMIRIDPFSAEIKYDWAIRMQ